MKQGLFCVFCIIVMVWVSGCQPATAVSITHPSATPTAVATVPPTATSTSTSSATLPPPPTFTAVPSSTPTAIPSATATIAATATAVPSPTPTSACDLRIPGDALDTVVTLQYGISRDYAPADLVSLNDYLPYRVTQGYPIEIRQPVVEPLVQMIEDMEAAGLHPEVLSGYRSYSAQSIAWAKWNEKNPETAAIVSAPPGHSEHQLGTTLDFGSPELPDLVGEEDIEFHTYFYMTSEGQWLLAHAHEYGFTLSYPREAFELTGFYYEPWHYRYIGVELATTLHEQGLAFTAYQLANFPEPCIP
ncbi:MAG: M15 family metallopeptidase [Ardenticatenaceae bacterium]|nr:M15 family metallopeptidase [Ardenticatenaceae bacterium]